MLAKATISRQPGLITDNLFLPFLYCTKTIRRRYVSDEYVPFETTTNSSDESRSNRESQQLRQFIEQSEGGRDSAFPSRERPRRQQRDGDSFQPYIPFERPSRVNRHADFEDTTITPTERRAFEGLFKLQEASQAPEGREKSSRGSRGSNSRERVRGQGAGGLDAILENAVETVDSRGRPRARFPAALRPLAEESRREKQRENGDGAEREVPQGDVLYETAKKEVTSVIRRMRRAETDVGVWQILEEDVFARVRALGLDSVEGPVEKGGRVKKAKKKKEKEKDMAGSVGSEADNTAAVSSNDKDKAGLKALSTTMTTPSLPPGITPLHFLSQTLHQILHHTLSHLKTHYPLSPLPLSIIPTLKTLGPTATALGLNTKLYNAHMRLLYTRYHDLHSISDTLQEMERGVYEFDSGTVELVDEILEAEGRKGRGLEGESMRVLVGMEGARRGFVGLEGWRAVLRERLVRDTLKRVRVREERERLVEVEEEGEEGVEREEAFA